ncbi:amidase signature domain-containing protein [Diplogelasinospora grovesii]|uniref:Amidase signature domain-containing protein n=1 Tax=Diplogelasinospora grovesii TaxID=303347 RepID=A0AAN6MWK0_9PEZI|nr:amidase signature domain-containing protein [Diplogelasinospora grovesii]
MMECVDGMHLASSGYAAGSDARTKPWQVVAAEKRQADFAKIPPEWVLAPLVVAEAKMRRSLVGPFFEGLLDDETRRITVMDVPELFVHISHGSLTAVQVVTAFSKRAAYIHQLTRNMLEIGFDMALKRARELDEYFRVHGIPIGPLHGIPVTVKDQFHIRGLETSMAFVGWIGTFEGKKGTGKEKHFESELIKELHNLGAVMIGKTSLVQSIWSPETSNNILGYLWSPHNQRLSSGGSSGGEAVMQALRGSAFGIGTDIGGSVSMPASYNGIFSLKPSSGRISMKDVANTGPGQQVMPTVAGIMGHSIQTLRLVLKSLLSTEPWLYDPYIVPLPWRDAEEVVDKDTRGEEIKPAIGFMENDGVVTPHPPVRRALCIVKEALRKAGYQLLDWNPPSNEESLQIHGQIARGDGCPDVWEALQLSGEPEVPEIEGLFGPYGPREPMSLREYQDVVVHMRDYRNRYQEYWTSTSTETENGRPVEVFISPVTATAGLLPDKFFYCEYTSCTNVLDYPTVVVPVTFADESVDKMDPCFKPFSETDRINMEAYDPSSYHGAPAAVQIVGRRLSEERLLAMAQRVVDALKRHMSGSD